MSDRFELLDRALAEGGPAAAFEHLEQTLREQKSYPMLFEARLMRKRLELGVPLIASGSPDELPADKRKEYEQAFIEAARETGSLYLADGDIVHAWPYFRAIGEPRLVSEAIEKAGPGEDMDGLIEIAFQEKVNPRKGFEFLLDQHGLCRAITFFSQYPGGEGREECLRLLVDTLYRDLSGSLRRTVAQVEGEAATEKASVRELIAGRDWLFGEHDYYVDTSHLVSVLRFATDLENRETLLKAVEMAEYGGHLAPMFHFRGDPPFENQYEDYGMYLRALAGESVDEAIAHFRRKIGEPGDPAAAQALVLLLARLNRYPDAIEIAAEYLWDVPPSQLACPSLAQLCQLAEDFDRLKSVARQQEDVLTYAAAMLQRR